MNRRENTLLKQTGSSANASWASSYTVTAYPVGAVASASSSGLTITVDVGHSFRAGDKILIDPGGDNTYVSEALASVTTTTLVLTSVTPSVTAGDKIVNLGPDSGAPTPNYDASHMKIYSDADGSSAISNARVTANSRGEYSFWHKGDGRFWELVRDSSGTVTKVIAGHAGDPGRINVQDFGARGDGTYSAIGTDDTKRLQAALDVMAKTGQQVYAPYGIYDTTAPIGITYGTLTPLEHSSVLYGDGWGQVAEASEGVTTIRGNGIGAGRAVLEFIGQNNTWTAQIEIRDMRVRAIGSNSTPVGTSNSGCYCLRLGDARLATVERVQFYGAHGVAVKISSSSGYSQICTTFRNCRIHSNWLNGFFADDDNATVYAVNVESGGAPWDQVRFDSCEFYGQVNTRASVTTLENCLHWNNTDRAAGYASGILATIGSLSVRDCYFEDCLYGVQAYGALAAVDSVVIDGCHFQSAVNAGVNDSVAAVLLTDSTYGLKAATISNCKFGTYDTDRDYSSGEILLNGNIGGIGAAEHQNTIGLNDITTSGTYTGTTREVFEITIDATGTPDTFSWRRIGNTAAPTTGVAITGVAQSLTDGVSITFGATTGHTLAHKWLIKAGWGGPENVIIDNCVMLGREGKTAFVTKPRIVLGANFLNNYLVRSHTGEISGRQRYDRGVVFTNNEDSTAHSIGMGKTGVELVNTSEVLSGGRGSESSITWRGLYESNRGKFAAIVGATSTRNTTTQTDGGFLSFLTKTNSDTALAERMRILEGGDIGIATTTPVCNLDINGDIKFGSVDVNVTGNDAIATADRCLINLTNVSGTNTITLNAPSSQNGKLIVLRLAALTAGTLTLADSGNVSLSTAWTPNADDTLTLIAAGVVWYEIARSAN